MGHFRDEPFQATNCNDTKNQTHNNYEKIYNNIVNYVNPMQINQPRLTRNTKKNIRLSLNNRPEFICIVHMG